MIVKFTKILNLSKSVLPEISLSIQVNFDEHLCVGSNGESSVECVE